MAFEDDEREAARRLGLAFSTFHIAPDGSRHAAIHGARGDLEIGLLLRESGLCELFVLGRAVARSLAEARVGTAQGAEGLADLARQWSLELHLGAAWRRARGRGCPACGEGAIDRGAILIRARPRRGPAELVELVERGVALAARLVLEPWRLLAALRVRPDEARDALVGPVADRLAAACAAVDHLLEADPAVGGLDALPDQLHELLGIHGSPYAVAWLCARWPDHPVTARAVAGVRVRRKPADLLALARAASRSEHGAAAIEAFEGSRGRWNQDWAGYGRIAGAIARRLHQAPGAQGALSAFVEDCRAPAAVGAEDWASLAQALGGRGPSPAATRAGAVAFLRTEDARHLVGLDPASVLEALPADQLAPVIEAGRDAALARRRAAGLARWLIDREPRLLHHAPAQALALARRMDAEALRGFARSALEAGAGAPDAWLDLARLLFDYRADDPVGGACLIEALRRDPTRREAADLMTRRLRSSAVPRELVALLVEAHNWPVVQGALDAGGLLACSAIVLWYDHADRAVDCLVRALDLEPASAEAWHAVLRLTAEGALPAEARRSLLERLPRLEGLAALAEDADDRDDLEVARLLAELTPLGIEHLLLRLLRNRRADVRLEAVGVLGRVGSPAALPALRLLTRGWLRDRALDAAARAAIASITARAGGEPGALSVAPAEGGELSEVKPRDRG